MKIFVWSFCFPCRVNQTVLFKFDTNCEDVHICFLPGFQKLIDGKVMFPQAFQDF